jgi:hypothetical protein
MTRWSKELEDDLAALLKDWLKQQGRTQSDLRRSLRATSTRMSALMEVLEREHVLGGMPRLAERLCAIEAEWATDPGTSPQKDGGFDTVAAQSSGDPFGQLDLLLREIRDDCTS